MQNIIDGDFYDEMDPTDLDAAGDMFDQLVSGKFYKNQEAAHAELKNNGANARRLMLIVEANQKARGY
jgi:hypothetical protein